MIPDWMPMDAWGEFVKMRKQIKRPMTEYAATLMIKRLAGFVDKGHDPQAVLDQSILNCWQNIYEVKPESLQMRAGQVQNAKFDPIAYVNRNRIR